MTPVNFGVIASGLRFKAYGKKLEKKRDRKRELRAEECSSEFFFWV